MASKLSAPPPADGPVPAVDLGGREDALRAFEQRIEAIETGLRRLDHDRERHAAAVAEARTAVAALTKKAHAADGTDTAAAKKYRARRARKHAAYTEATRALERAKAEHARLIRERAQVERNIVQLEKLRVRVGYRRLWARLRGLRDEDDTGAQANTYIPPVVLAFGAGLAFVLLLTVVRYQARQTIERNPQAAGVVIRFARFVGWVDDPSGITTAESVEAANAALARTYGPGRAARAQTRAAPLAPRTPPLQRLSTRKVSAMGSLRGPLWQSTFETPTVYRRPKGVKHMPMVDLDGDGRPEWILNDRNNRRILIYAKSTDTGGFVHRETIETERSPERLHVADVNDDGAPDLLLPHAWNQSPFWCLLNRGDGSFERQVVDQGVTHWLAATADLDGDGILDIATGGRRGAYVFRGLGAGAFAERVQVHARERQNMIAVGDFNGDGTLDIATADHYNWSKPAAESMVTVALLTPDLLPAGTPKANRMTPAILAMAPIDFDRKDGTDLVALRYAGTRTNANGHAIYDVVLLWNGGNGRFDVVKCGRTVAGNALVVFDIDGDGREDVLAGNRAFLNDGRALVPYELTFAPNAYPWWFDLRDIDGDGRRELVCVSWWNRVGVYPLLRDG